MRRNYIIAEAGVNHNGSLEMAKKMICVAAQAGADAVKFQTFKAENLVSKNAPKAQYQQNTTSTQETQYDMLKKLEIDEETHNVLVEHCKQHGVQFLSTPFDISSMHFLVKKYDLQYIKIPSGEITNAPFLLEIARTGKNVILSTGMSTLGDVEAALKVLAFGYVNNSSSPSLTAFDQAYFSERGQTLLKERVVLLHCTTEYPAPFEEVNLKAMDTLKVAFDLPVGYSDHTQGISIPIAAVARGAVMIEKHFTLDCNLPGPDHRASLEPKELKEMIQSIRQVEKAIGVGSKIPSPSEYKNLSVVRKSLVAACKIQKGEVFTDSNITTKRPGDGMLPFFFWDLIGKTAERAYEKDEIL